MEGTIVLVVIVAIFFVVVLPLLQRISMQRKLDSINDRLWEIERLLNNRQGDEETASEPQRDIMVEDEAPPAVFRPLPTFEEESRPPVVIVDDTKAEDHIREVLNGPVPEPDSVESTRSEIGFDFTQNKNNDVPAEPVAGWYARFVERNPDLEKFIGENLISKIGITILVLGIAFFVKLAIDKKWIGETARVGIGILSGGIVLGFAHRLRVNFKAFSSVLVAGGISIFYFTIGIAFQEYHIFTQTAAFVMMVGITAFSILISVSYDRQELAVLSLIGGFAAPFIVSTGSGNYQALFTYIIVLDLGMLVLSYLRNWNLVNILTYVFTVVLFGAWLNRDVIPGNGPYIGALAFGSSFYLIFILMNVVNNVKEKRPFGSTEFSLILSNTFLYYAAGMLIFEQYLPAYKGAFTISLATFNFALTYLLYKRFRIDTNLVYLLIGLTLTFSTLAAPVQLHGNFITLFWSAEAVLLVWLAQRSGIGLYRFVALLVTGLSFISLIMDWQQTYGAGTTHEMIVLNKGFITGVFTIACMLVFSYLLRREEIKEHHFFGIEFNSKAVADASTGIVAVITYFTGVLELYYQLNFYVGTITQMYAITAFYHLVFTSVFIYFSSDRLRPSVARGLLYVFGVSNLAVYIFVSLRLALTEVSEAPLENFSHIAFITHFAALALIVWLIPKLYSIEKKRNPVFCAWAFTAMLTFLVSAEVLLVTLATGAPATTDYSQYSMQIDQLKTATTKIAFPVVWGLIAFILLSAGIRRRYRYLRISALVLLGITLLKLIFYDMNGVSDAGKIIAFVLLGVVLLVISFMYQKIKAILLTDENEVADNEEA